MMHLQVPENASCVEWKLRTRTIIFHSSSVVGFDTLVFLFDLNVHPIKVYKPMIS